MGSPLSLDELMENHGKLIDKMDDNSTGFIDIDYPLVNSHNYGNHWKSIFVYGKTHYFNGYVKKIPVPEGNR